MKRKEFALVLAGGGTRGAYQLGAWKALRELDIKIVAVAGASIGAINGAMIVQDDYEALEKIYKDIKIDDIFEVSKDVDPKKDIFHVSNLLALATDYIKKKGLSNEPLRKMLNKYIDIKKFYDSDIDFGLSTFSIDNFETFEVFKEDMEKDRLVDYILASACFPIFKVQNISGKKYIDGGTADNLPVRMLTEKGYKRIIAVDLDGISLKNKITQKNVYIKIIRPSIPLGGIFEFNKNRMAKNAEMGYMDTLKTFGKLQGNILFFKLTSYKKLLNEFPVKTVNALEFAAKEYGFDIYEIYTKEKFIKKLLKCHKKVMKEFKSMKKNMKSIKSVLKEFEKEKQFPNKSFLICYFAELIQNDPLYLKGKDATLFKEHVEAARALLDLEHR